MPPTCFLPSETSNLWRRRYFNAQLRLLGIQDHALFGFTTSQEGLFLAEMTVTMPANSVAVELGTFLGKSARYLALGTLCSGSKLFCVDPFKQGPDAFDGWDRFLLGSYRNVAVLNIETSLSQSQLITESPETEHVICYQGSSSFVANNWWQIYTSRFKGQPSGEKGNLDNVTFLFIDGDHTRCEQDYEEWLPLLTPWAMVVVDDVLVNGAYGPFGPDNTIHRMQKEGWKLYANLGKLVFLTRDLGWWHLRREAVWSSAVSVSAHGPCDTETASGGPASTDPLG